jgi:dihydrofolate reductase
MTPRFSVFIAASLDGFIARPDGGLDWLEAVHTEGEDYGYQGFFESVDAVLLGAGTYETVRSFEEWPYGDKPVFVASARPWAPVKRESFIQGNPVVMARQLGQRDYSRVYLDGGALIRSFLAAGMVADMTLSIVPVLLGAGIPLFRERGKEPSYGEHGLKLTGTQAYPSGLVQLKYERA